MKPLTVFQQHVQDWQDCRDCTLHETRQHVVMSRGRVPCDVLYIGEAPGEGEDAIGRPFVGPAGKLLDRLIAQASAAVGGPERFRTAFTNLVCCIPRDEDGLKTETPHANEIVTCGPRLAEFVAIARPRLIVCVGAIAEKWVLAGKLFPYAGAICHIEHPGSILKKQVVVQGLAAQRALVQLRTALIELSSKEG